MRSTRAHIIPLNGLNLGRNWVTRQKFTLLWEKNQQNSWTASYAAVIQKVNKYHFWKNLRWWAHPALSLVTELCKNTEILELQPVWQSFPRLSKKTAWSSQVDSKWRMLPWRLPPVPPTKQHWSDPSGALLPQLGEDKALLNPIVHWAGANPGQFGIYHCTFEIFTKHIHKTLQPLGTQGREGSIENTAQGRQQEHLLSDSQERGEGGEEEREVSYH